MELAKKMKIGDGPVYLLKEPPGGPELFGDKEVITRLTGKKPISQVLLFAEQKDVLDDMFAKLVPRLEDDGLLWIAHPKKSGKIKSDISRDTGWDVLTAEGYIPVTSVSIDENWSALRFRKADLVGPKQRDTEIAERKVEGIDFVNRTITLPGDIKEGFAAEDDVLQFFNTLSFSHKREYVEHIVSAKKPETRARRIDKTIALLKETKAKNK